MTPATVDRRHYRLCRFILDPWRRRPCNCADLDPVLGPKEAEAYAEKLRAAGVEGAAK